MSILCLLAPLECISFWFEKYEAERIHWHKINHSTINHFTKCFDLL